MERLLGVLEVLEMLGWGKDRATYRRDYSRAFSAACQGYAGNLRRVGRHLVLTRKQAETLAAHLRKKWPAEAQAEAQAVAG